MEKMGLCALEELPVLLCLMFLPRERWVISREQSSQMGQGGGEIGSKEEAVLREKWLPGKGNQRNKELESVIRKLKARGAWVA